MLVFFLCLSVSFASACGGEPLEIDADTSICINPHQSIAETHRWMHFGEGNNLDVAEGTKITQSGTSAHGDGQESKRNTA